MFVMCFDVIFYMFFSDPIRVKFDREIGFVPEKRNGKAMDAAFKRKYRHKYHKNT